MFFVFYAPGIKKYKHIDYEDYFKTEKAAKKHIKESCAEMSRVYPNDEWPESDYFLAKRMK